MPGSHVVEYKGYFIWHKSGKQAKIYDSSGNGLDFERDASSLDEAKKMIDWTYETGEELLAYGVEKGSGRPKSR